MSKDIINNNVSPILGAPMYDHLARLKPSHSSRDEFKSATFQTMLKQYLNLVLKVFEFGGTGTDAIIKNSGMFSLARTINKLMNYEYTLLAFGNLHDTVVPLAKKHPLVFSSEILNHGYEYTMHLSPQEIENVLAGFLELMGDPGKGSIHRIEFDDRKFEPSTPHLNGVESLTD